MCTLPYTGRRVVNRIITDLCVMEVVDAQTGQPAHPGTDHRVLRIVELAPGVTTDEVYAKSEPGVWHTPGEVPPEPVGLAS